MTLRQIVRLLRSAGWTLVRQRKHKVFRSPDGFTLTASVSPSDGSRAAKNVVATLRRMERRGCAHVPFEILTRARREEIER